MFSILSNSKRLRGTLPTEIGLLENLRLMDLRSCFFEGPIPTQFWNLKKLENLTLSQNPLTDARIPTLIAGLSNLKEL